MLGAAPFVFLNMADDTEKSPLEQVVEVLVKHDVEFIVIGGQAETLFGSPRITYDIDVCYRRTRENLERLARALPEFQPKLRGAPPDLPCEIDARALALGNNYTFTTNIVDLDLLGHCEPIGGYDDLAKRATRIRVGAHDVLVIDLDDLIRIKEHLCRRKDSDSLVQLLAIKRARQPGP